MTRRTLSPVALSRLTWTADDRQAWRDAYRAALRADVRAWNQIGGGNNHTLAMAARDLAALGAMTCES